MCDNSKQLEQQPNDSARGNESVSKDETQPTSMMSREEAEQKLKEWAEYLELDIQRSFFEDVLDALTFPTMKGRLDFRYEDETFLYRLIKPIQHTNTMKETVEIFETKYESTKVLDRIKENQKHERAAALMTRRTNLLMPEVEQLSQRDEGTISAIVLGFFGQTKSTR